MTRTYKQIKEQLKLIGFEIEYRRCLIGTAYTIWCNHTGENIIVINKHHLEEEVDRLLATREPIK